MTDFFVVAELLQVYFMYKTTEVDVLVNYLKMRLHCVHRGK